MEKVIRIDDNMDSYQSFFDHEWSRNIEKISQSTKLEEPAFDLSATWKGIANARRMPWLMVGSIKIFAERLLNRRTPFPVEILNKVVDKIANTSEKNYFRHLSTMQRKTLCKVIEESQDEVIQALQDNPITMNKEEFWSGLLQHTEIQLTLWMSEVNAYASVYFAYEAFLIKSMKIALSLDSLRVGDRPGQLKDRLENTLGNLVLNQCWADPEIEKARLIRHAITHAGCKMIHSLEKYRKDILLEDNEIIILARQTNDLYNLLKERATLFSREIVNLPSMRL